VCPQRLGFAVFKGPKKLLDWGGSTYVRGNKADAVLLCQRISSLLTIYGPSVVVARNIAGNEIRRYADIRPIVRLVRVQAEKFSAEAVLMGRQEVRYAFRRFGNTTRYNIAAQVAIFFPELLWKLPPPRKPWQKERYSMAMFDAVAMGITYFSRFGEFGLDFRSIAENSKPA